jgi:hypothetical protein
LDRKTDATNVGRRIARNSHVDVIIQKRDGTIHDRDSYGTDPYPPRDSEH